MADEFREKVYRAVAMIPKGKVGSYAQVAELAGFPGAARAVGNALHLNTDPLRFPCHRVVRSDGGLASGYAFGGPEGQRKRLLTEGVLFKDPYESAAEKAKVDMKCFLAIRGNEVSEDHILFVNLEEL